jgi:hypothetical protein
MHKFREELLHFIWKFRLLPPGPLSSVSGKEVVVLLPGEHNANSGPDFFNAQVKINGLTLAGNIEIHLKTSDWLKHGHQFDHSYDNIILHVVYEHDRSLEQNISHGVEVIELKNQVEEATLTTYETIAAAKSGLPCSAHLAAVKEIDSISWLERMTVERLEEKVQRIDKLFNQYTGNYRQTFFTLLMRNFGFMVNGVPMELLARSVPFDLLLRHADDLQRLEALLFGMSGMLDDVFEDKYMRRLQNEFEFLRQKYKLIPLDRHLFKFSRMRPANFPTVRLAQMALLIHTCPRFFISPDAFTEIALLKRTLHLNLQDYWSNHYTPDGNETHSRQSLGENSVENIIINTVTPFLFFYGKKTGNGQLCEKAEDLLHACRPEDNYKTRKFSKNPSLNRDAAASQALIHLLDNYCSKKQCLRCGIAASILKPKELVTFK